MTNSGMQDAINQGMQGDEASKLGDFASAATHCAETADLCRKLGEEKLLARAVYNQGLAAQGLGDFASASTHFAEAADLFRKLGDDVGLALTRDLQAELARHLEGQN